MKDKTNSEALTLRAEIQSLLESHPFSSVQALLQNALAYDPDNKKARLLNRKLKLVESVKKEGNDAFASENYILADEIYTRIINDDTDSAMMKIKVLSNRATSRSKVFIINIAP